MEVEVHVHDNNASINKVIRERTSIQNFKEQWHATRPITAGLRKIGQGVKNTKGKTWHPEFSDKGALLRNHVYWAIDNCNNDGSQLKANIEVCINHFQNKHDACNMESECKHPDWPSFTILKDPVAVNLLGKFIKSLTVYKKAENYVLGCDTYYVESFNNKCLIYLDKRIHYGDLMYELCSALVVLDWNEHVDRPYTSVHKSLKANKPRMHSGN